MPDFVVRYVLWNPRSHKDGLRTIAADDLGQAFRALHRALRGIRSSLRVEDVTQDGRLVWTRLGGDLDAVPAVAVERTGLPAWDDRARVERWLATHRGSGFHCDGSAAHLVRRADDGHSGIALVPYRFVYELIAAGVVVPVGTLFNRHWGCRRAEDTEWELPEARRDHRTVAAIVDGCLRGSDPGFHRRRPRAA